MRPPTRIPSPRKRKPSPSPGAAPGARLHGDPPPAVPAPGAPVPRNPYDELAALADPGLYLDPGPGRPGGGRRGAYGGDRDPLGLGLRPDDAYEDPYGDAYDDDWDDRDGEGDDAWAPPDHRRPRRARAGLAGLPFALKTVVALAVAAAFLTVADRWAALYAEQRVQEKLKDSLHLAAEPQVTIHGFPFLAQLAAKRLARVDVVVPDVAANRVSLARVQARAEDIRLSGTLPNGVRGAVISRVRGSVLLSFDDLNRELGASQVRFTEEGRNSVLAVGALPIAGHSLSMRAEAHIRRVGGRGVETDISGMRLDIADIATFRPGSRDGAGLRLTRRAADRVRHDVRQVKALLSVPALARRFGVPRWAIEQTLRSEERLHEITGAPRFVRQVMRLNLVDVVARHPELLERIGLDPSLVTELRTLTERELSHRLSLSFELPELPGYVRLRTIAVERDGIRADLSGMDLPFGSHAR